MRKLKLQVQITVDGFVAGPNGELDWMAWDQDDRDIATLVNTLTDSSDTIIMGRKMTDEFMNYWENVVNNQPDSPEFSFAKKMVDIPKVVFSKTLDKSRWTNTVLAKGDIVDEVNRLKNQPGKDIIVYGGASFVSALIKESLIDEFNLFVNPTILSKGMHIFETLGKRQKLTPINSKHYACGITVLQYSANDK
jgi:dihydrofolate reductase